MAPSPSRSPRWRWLAAACLFVAASAAAATPAVRVITLAPHLTELVCAAAGCETLVAVTAYSDFPPAVRGLPVVGDVAQLNLEAVLALQPTHLIAWAGGTPAAQLDRLGTLGLPVTAIAVEHLDEVAEALETLGRLLGTPARAAAAAADYRQRLAALRSRHERVRPVRVLYQIETAPVYSINRASPISEAIRLCGGVNVFDDLPTLAAPVSDEAVLASAPEVVVHGLDDAKPIRAYWQRFAAGARRPPAFAAVDPDLLARAGPRLIDGVAALCAALDGVRAR